MKNKIDFLKLDNISKQIRATCVQMAHDSKHGHLKSALTSCKILVNLYWNFLNLNPKNIFSQNRDRFFMSKGHGVSALYAVLAKKKFIPLKSLNTYCISNSSLPDHPCKHSLNILESSSGSLGHCLGIATGSLYALNLKGINSKIAVLLSDGECNEGSVWESAMFAASKQLSNLLVIVDYNGFQAVGKSDEIMGFTSLEDKFKSFGWNAITIDGEKSKNFNSAFKLYDRSLKKPTAIIAKTKTGISFMNNDNLWHYRVPSDLDLEKSIKELKVKPIHLMKHS
tara:strand:+ start:89 stop:934 length:846 start_codon:yes stop_codon:yes gene_type:complete